MVLYTQNRKSDSMKDYQVVIETRSKFYVEADSVEEAEEKALDEFWDKVSNLEPEIYDTFSLE